MSITGGRGARPLDPSEHVSAWPSSVESPGEKYPFKLHDVPALERWSLVVGWLIWGADEAGLIYVGLMAS